MNWLFCCCCCCCSKMSFQTHTNRIKIVVFLFDNKTALISLQLRNFDMFLVSGLFMLVFIDENNYFGCTNFAFFFFAYHCVCVYAFFSIHFCVPWSMKSMNEWSERKTKQNKTEKKEKKNAHPLWWWMWWKSETRWMKKPTTTHHHLAYQFHWIFFVVVVVVHSQW